MSRQMPQDRLDLRVKAAMKQNLKLRPGVTVDDLTNIAEHAAQQPFKSGVPLTFERAMARATRFARAAGLLHPLVAAAATGIPAKLLEIYENTKPGNKKGPKVT